jgi:NAD-dependent DNA ligase
MSNFFARQGGAYANEMKRSLGALLGIAQGVLADGVLTDAEIKFLDDWLTANSAIATAWPGDVLHRRIRAVLEDGVVTMDERAHLVDTLTKLVGGRLEDLANLTHVTEMIFDDVPSVQFAGSVFCLTGNFVYAPREVCIRETEQRGGLIKTGVSKKLNYLVVGGLGSPEWKHGSFGTKIEKAMQLKQKAPIAIVHEDLWAKSLFAIAAG